MPKYQLTGEGYVIKDDNIKVPISTVVENTNPDYLEYLEWLAAGNVPDSAPETEKTGVRVIRDWEFRNRFTQEQLVGVMRAALSGDDVAALVWLALCTASDGVNLDSKEHIKGVQYIATAYPELKIDPAVILN